MAMDKAVDSAELDGKLRELADAIRTKGGTDQPLDFLSGGFRTAVEQMSVGKISPYKKIEVRTWTGDGTCRYDTGLGPNAPACDIMMTAEVWTFNDTLVSTVAISNAHREGLSDAYGAVFGQFEDYLMYCTMGPAGIIEVECRDIDMVFGSGVRYTVVICYY